MIEVRELKKGDIYFHYNTNRTREKKIRPVRFLQINPVDKEVLLFVDSEYGKVIELSIYELELGYISKELKPLIVMLKEHNKMELKSYSDLYFLEKKKPWKKLAANVK